MGCQVVAHALAHCLARFDRSRGVVRLQQDIAQRQKARVQVWLAFEHVQGR